MTQDRRSFLASLGAAALAASCRNVLAHPAASRPNRLSRVGIQLYTVRRQAATDLPGVLSRLAAIGYKEVEFENYFNKSPADIAGMLRSAQIAAPSSHVTVESVLRSDSRVFEYAHALGHEWLVARSLPRGSRATLADWRETAKQFNAAAARVKAEGLRFAFHNHNDVFKPVGNTTPIDVLMAETDPSIMSYQMDIFWTVSGGANPLLLLDKYRDRFSMLHLKDGKGPPFTEATQTDVGSGQIDFRPILAKAPRIQHYFVESDSAADPMQFAASSYRYLSNIEF